MADELTTKPTLDTLLKRINAVFEQGIENQREMRALRTTVEQRFEVIETRLDRIESLANQTRAEMLAMRADFRELRSEFNGLRSRFEEPA
ncbi:MAG: hypothetical protein WCF57_06600 [Pyrinomonadaceae bacterium]